MGRHPVAQVELEPRHVRKAPLQAAEKFLGPLWGRRSAQQDRLSLEQRQVVRIDGYRLVEGGCRVVDVGVLRQQLGERQPSRREIAIAPRRGA